MTAAELQETLSHFITIVIWKHFRSHLLLIINFCLSDIVISVGIHWPNGGSDETRCIRPIWSVKHVMNRRTQQRFINSLLWMLHYGYCHKQNNKKACGEYAKPKVKEFPYTVFIFSDYDVMFCCLDYKMTVFIQPELLYNSEKKSTSMIKCSKQIYPVDAWCLHRMCNRFNMLKNIRDIM